MRSTPDGTAADDYPTALTAAAVTAWDQFVSDGRLAPSSRALYRGIAERFLRWLEARGIELTRVTPELVQEYLDAGGITVATKYQYRRMLSRFFDALVTHGVIPNNPAELLRALWKDLPASAPPAGATETLADQFTRFTPVERQATVDAAALALAMHEIHLFTRGAGGRRADLERCEEALRLGEQDGITPLSWVESSDASATPESTEPHHPSREPSPPTDND